MADCLSAASGFSLRPLLRLTAMQRLLAFILPTMMLLEPATRASEPKVNTFSIVAHDPATGEIGVAVESRYFAVGTVVPWAQAGVGAVATQAQGNVSYGANGLKQMQEGKAPREVIDALTAADAKREVRQVAMIDAKGRVAAFTGKECMLWAGHREGEGYSVQGNLLTGEAVVTAMADAFEKARKEPETELADWLMAAMQAGQAAGGDRRGQQSAAILVVKEGTGPGKGGRYIDLRVDDHAKPIDELERLLELHKQFHGRPQKKK
jgi:uncharacterized Ntn-hydrolase superfamily protein